MAVTRESARASQYHPVGLEETPLRRVLLGNGAKDKEEAKSLAIILSVMSGSSHKAALSPRLAQLERSSLGNGQRVLYTDVDYKDDIVNSSHGVDVNRNLQSVSQRSIGNVRSPFEIQANRAILVNNMNTEQERRSKTVLLAKDVLSRYKQKPASNRVALESAASSSGFSSQDDEVANQSDDGLSVKSRTSQRGGAPSPSSLIDDAVRKLEHATLPDAERSKRMSLVYARTPQEGGKAVDDSPREYNAGGNDEDTDRHGRGWDVAIKTVRERMKRSRLDHLKNSDELELLRKQLEETSVKSHSYQAEIAPLQEKLKRYEAIIEDLEEKIQAGKNAIVQNERTNLASVADMEKRHENYLLSKEEQLEEERLSLKRDLNRSQNEVKMLDKQLHETKAALDKARSSNGNLEDDSHPTSRSARHIKQELDHVRKILEESEQDRLKERKEKLSAVQNMIKLTKEKSELEEELDERRRTETSESSTKFAKLSVKFSECEGKLQKLRQSKASELEDMQRRYMEEMRQLKVTALTDKESLEKEVQCLKDALRTADGQSGSPSSPTSVHYHGGRWSAMRSEDRKHASELKEIMTELNHEGLGPDKVSSDEIVRVLFNRWKDAKSALVELPQEGNFRSVTENFREEKRSMKRKIEELQESNASKDGQMKVVEMSLRRQIEDLLAEKKSAFFQMQNALDLADNARHEAEENKLEQVKTEQALNRRVTELEMMRENLMNVTNELKLVDANYCKLKRDLSVKEAELNRISQDLDLAQNHIQSEARATQDATTDSEEKRRVIRDGEKIRTNLEEQVQHLGDSLASKELRVERLLKDRDELKAKHNSTRMKLNELETAKVQREETIDGLQIQLGMLEESLQEKVKEISTMSLEVETTSTNLAAAHHLLKSEEIHAETMEHEIESLLDQLEAKETEIEKWKINATEMENNLRSVGKELTDIKSGQRDLVQSYKSESATRSELEEEIIRLGSLLEERDSSVINLEAKIRSKESMLLQEKTASQELQEKLCEHVNNLAFQAENVDELAQSNKVLGSQNEALRRENQSLFKQLESKTSFSNQETDKTRQLNDKLEEAFQKHRDALAELARNKLDTEEIITQERQEKKLQTGVNRKLNQDIEMANEILAHALQPLNESDSGDLEMTDDLLSLVEAAAGKLQSGQKVFQAKCRELDDVRTTMDSMSHELLSMRKAVANEKAQKTDSQSCLELAKMDEMRLRKKLSDATAELNAVHESREQLESQLEETTLQLRRALQQLNERESNDDHSRMRDSSLDDIEASRKRVEDLSRDNVIKSQEIDLLRASINKSQNSKRNEDDENIVHHLQSQIDSLKLENESLTANCRNLTAVNEPKKRREADNLDLDHDIKQMRLDNVALQNNVLSLEEDNSKLRRSLKRYHHRLKMLGKKEQLQGLPDNTQHILQAELEKESKEKCEALECLKALVRDNEILTKCISQMHREMEAHKKEAARLKAIIHRIEHGSARDHDMLDYFKDVMETSLRREQELTEKEVVRLKALLAAKQEELDKLRARNNDVEKQLMVKDKELNRATSESFSLRATMEINVGRQLSRDMSLTQDGTDRTSYLKRMNSMELSNHLLLNRIKDMQKWHHAMEVELVQTPTQMKPLDEMLRNSFTNLSAMNLTEKEGFS